MVSKKSLKKKKRIFFSLSSLGKTEMYWGKMWLFLIGNGAEIRPLEKDRKSSVKDHNAVTPVRLEPVASQSSVKHSSTALPIHKDILNFVQWKCRYYFRNQIIEANKCQDEIIYQYHHDDKAK